jgi:Aerotolerance regulator N-terminal
MSFLQPWFLAALPLVALPIIIHLINQRRYQTVRWAAMMFLLAANRMSRGYARLRQWLIMAFRMAAIAALVFAVSRPLSGGWLSLTGGGRADTTIVLLDGSPSMQQGQGEAGGSKLETGRRQLAATLGTLGSSRWVLIGGGTNRPHELDSASALLTATAAGPTSAASDIPGMLEAARDHVRANKPGRTEVWICSDLRRNDWEPDDGRWRTLREAFLGFPQGMRFHLLAYPRTSSDNLSVRVTGVRRQGRGDGAELLVSFVLIREGDSSVRSTVPVRFEIGGASSELTVEMAGRRFEVKDHPFPLERGRERGWGRVSIPADSNPADNDFYFAYGPPAPRRAVVVADDLQAARPLELAASVPPDPALKCSAEVVSPAQVSAVEWTAASLLLWQAPLPGPDEAAAIRAFVEHGGQVIFFPPRTPGGNEFLGVRWTTWANASAPATVETWRGDEDLLAKTSSGVALPVGQIEVRKSCGLAGDFTPLATLRGGAPLLARVATSGGGVYFCATTPAPGDSSLATNGVVLYVMVQRAQAAGADVLETTRSLAAGQPSGENPALWKWLGGDDDALSTDYAYHRGVYASGERLLAVNRPAAEDAAPVLQDDVVAGLFRGLDFARVDDREGSLATLIQEVWRPFLVAMMTALVVEAGLCMPRPARAGRPAS